jgi:RNAse (barnase) inhibitor barstar
MDLSKVGDRDSFHAAFASAFGFPNWYGRNMDAWIDCMTNLDDPGRKLSRVLVTPGEVVTLQLDHVKDFSTRLPDLYASIIEGAAFVNWRRLDKGRPSILALAFYG